MIYPEKNLLAGETSPYLRQHGNNPVHWRPWSPAALAEAATTDRPILLSVGYAACHWCHVMAHESFENPAIAAVMNRLFVNIKVDREERPDIDQIYMAALNATGEQGGWPTTMFLTPEGKPFWGGTYFPPQGRNGRPGFVDVLNSVHQAWLSRRDKLAESAEILTSHVQSRLAAVAGSGELSADPLRLLAEHISKLIDPKRGGLTGAPKFPNAPFLNALWINGLASPDAFQRQQLVHSVKMMCSGGIFDHVGGGLCRYSTDAEWIVPHFEKMLYDNAQLVRHLCLAFAETGDEVFATRMKQTIEWLAREMVVEGGGFASSLDADSDGEEGKFYTWTRGEADSVLGAQAARFFSVYDLAAPHGWEGDPILHRLGHPDHSGDESESALAASLERLRVARDTRIRPGRDDKVLVDWNGLAIRALAEAGRQFANPGWVDLAKGAYRFVIESSDDAGRLPHSILVERRLFPGLSSDYAAMISAAVALFEATGDRAYLDQGRNWSRLLDAWHGDGDGGHFLTSSDAADLPMRIRGDSDDPVPSATAQIVEALVRLSSATGDMQLHLSATRAAELALGRAAGQQYGQAGIFCAAAIAYAPLKLVIVEEEGALAAVAAAYLDPRRVDLVFDLAGSGDAASALPEGMRESEAPAAWLCTGQTCLPPIRDAAELARALRPWS
ncbi:MAG: thioredoxin domain-containing protein [Mesorhizobium sp.]|nr:thioredoxin domain-containing protein [Mesorhizobium sp.]